MNNLIIVLIPLIVVSILLLSYATFSLVKIKEDRLELEREKFYHEIDFELPIKILDSIINEEFMTYKLLYLLYSDDYITERDEMEIIKIITAKVYKRMTTEIVNNLRFVYKIEDEETDLINIISMRVSFVVMNYVTENNQSKK